jgi:adapter protein MecA 1/2
MKIEKISDNQIRCNLTEADLEERQIQINELAYGSEKARALFRDMMIQAHREYGFTNDANIPLMIEAIPGSGNSLTLVITKVEDPEELDTRFAKFSPTAEVADDVSAPPVEGADDIIDIFHKLLDAKTANIRKKNPGNEASEPQPAEVKGKDSLPKKTGKAVQQKDAARTQISISRAFRFRNIDEAIGGAHALNDAFKGPSTLFRAGKAHSYLLVVHQPPTQTPEEFNKVCNILSEYGASESCTPSSEAYLREHSEIIIGEDAVSKLASVIRDRS